MPVRISYTNININKNTVSRVNHDITQITGNMFLSIKYLYITLAVKFTVVNSITIFSQLILHN